MTAAAFFKIRRVTKGGAKPEASTEEEVSVALLALSSCRSPALRRFLLGRMYRMSPGAAGRLPITALRDAELGLREWQSYVQRRVNAVLNGPDENDKGKPVDKQFALVATYLDIITMLLLSQ